MALLNDLCTDDLVSARRAMTPSSVIEAFVCLDWLGSVCELPSKSKTVTREVRRGVSGAACPAQPRALELSRASEALESVVDAGAHRWCLSEREVRDSRRMEESDIHEFYGICAQREGCGASARASEPGTAAAGGGICGSGEGIPPMLGVRLGSRARGSFRVALVEISEAASRDERLGDLLASLQGSPVRRDPD